ncbi:flagellar basal body L-ring protein FlgH [Aquabacterium sp. CECT 9606]|jgi:flagellar L-ring protein precursor FlgH|uniref:flagellar basal body L-ring protein FlgH n=1 Tax=Aquabacterium sp. CECT 9606 TaxID=2845822 RepID=UPI001E2CBF75|nr:flagellar basal body L-ring protein FlgH [Aquabacterium sp. CECT 9606]CAH0349212.1 Flagellar L-ring protein [Aquabacterium sp. CECT 9606]
MNTLRRRASLALIAAACSLLGACSVLPTTAKVDVLEPTQARPAVPVVPEIANGSLFQSAGYRPLFETHRARLVGDIVNVTIVEKIAAKQESTSSIEKTGDASASVSAVPLLRAEQLAKLRLSASGTSSNTFDGKGTTESSHNFVGTITATVIEVLPNGHLVISGEKQIGVNKNVELLRFSGQIDPTTIQPGNTVASTQVANVRIEQRGRGAQADAQGIGWLAHFFLSILPI